MIIVINDYTKFQQNSTLSSQIIDREKKSTSRDRDPACDTVIKDLPGDASLYQYNMCNPTESNHFFFKNVGCTKCILPPPPI